MIKIFLLQAMKTWGRVEVELHAFFTSALVGREWSFSQPTI